MDEYLNNRHTEIFWNLLTNPVNNGHLYVSDLQQLVKEYPQSGFLHALLSHSDNKQNLGQAAAYFDPKALYVLVTAPESLAEVPQSQIIEQLKGKIPRSGLVEQTGTVQKEEEIHHPGNNSDIVTEKSPVADEHDYISAFTPFVTETDREHFHTDVKEENAGPDVHDETTEHIADHLNHEEPKEEESLTVHPVAETDPWEHDEVNAVTTTPPADDHYDVYNPGEAHHGLNEIEVEDETPKQEVIEETNETLVDENIDHPAEEQEIVEEVLAEQHQPGINDNHSPEHETVVDNPEVALPEETVEEHESAEFSPIEQHKPGEAGHDIREDEQLTETPIFKLTEQPHDIEDDVYDEIVGIEDISFKQADKAEHTVIPEQEEPIAEEEKLPEEIHSAPQAEVHKEPALNLDDEAEKLIVGNIAATDYFVFDKAFNDRKPVETAISEPVETKPVAEEENNEVSRYNDDTMPYTFLWWLNKTRREHAGVYQPFKLDTTQAIRQQASDELQQQYYENIFHLGSVEELDRSTAQPAVEFDPKRKEDRIIKKFITEDPHISPPSSDKLGNENKAKKSSEDQDEFVTETLARIYTDQMLYHKAIHAYKKLILKFPEKSRYFADQIEQLERKSN